MSGLCIWLTGLSGAGKSTVANRVHENLRVSGLNSFVLDGDNIRRGLCKDLGFSDKDRSENIRRIAEVARLMADAGLIIIVAFISPFRADRQFARSLFRDGQFLEVYISTPIEECERRDPKGLYAKVRNGAVERFTGINSPYEPPIHPEITIDTIKLSVDESAGKIINLAFRSPSTNI